MFSIIILIESKRVDFVIAFGIKPLPAPPHIKSAAIFLLQNFTDERRTAWKDSALFITD